MIQIASQTSKGVFRSLVSRRSVRVLPASKGFSTNSHLKQLRLPTVVQCHELKHTPQPQTVTRIHVVREYSALREGSYDELKAALQQDHKVYQQFLQVRQILKDNGIIVSTAAKQKTAAESQSSSLFGKIFGLGSSNLGQLSVSQLWKFLTNKEIKGALQEFAETVQKSENVKLTEEQKALIPDLLISSDAEGKTSN